jgi:hypothetical protein
MAMTITASWRFLFGWLATFVLAPAALACNVPVYRYALERWQPDPYPVVIFHRGPLSAADKARVDRLEKAADGVPAPANVQPWLVDLDKEKFQPLLDLFATQKNPVLPWAVVKFPEGSRINDSLYAGPLDDNLLNALLDSPVRREVARRIINGDTAVWVLLECGDKEKDSAAADLLQAQARELPKMLKLPDLTDDPADQVLGGELKIAFSVIRLARTDPAERLFVETLLRTEDDLVQFQEPMVFMVFGRGRTLPALVGKGITTDNIAEGGHFLVGPCSCEVKRANPGADLLMTADWEKAIGQRRVKEPTIPELTGLSEFVDPKTLPAERLSVKPREVVDAAAEYAVQPAITKPAPEEPISAAAAPAPSPSFLFYYVLAGAGAGLALLMVVTFLWQGKTRSP